MFASIKNKSIITKQNLTLQNVDEKQLLSNHFESVGNVVIVPPVKQNGDARCGSWSATHWRSIDRSIDRASYNRNSCVPSTIWPPLRGAGGQTRLPRRDESAPCRPHSWRSPRGLRRYCGDARHLMGNTLEETYPPSSPLLLSVCTWIALRWNIRDCGPERGQEESNFFIWTNCVPSPESLDVSMEETINSSACCVNPSTWMSN